MQWTEYCAVRHIAQGWESIKISSSTQTSMKAHSMYETDSQKVMHAGCGTKRQGAHQKAGCLSVVDIPKADYGAVHSHGFIVTALKHLPT